jgi:serine/threonine protein phosphatase PrpC
VSEKSTVDEGVREEAEPAAKAESRERSWSRHPNDRWIVGDEGRQPDVRPRLAKGFKAPPPDIVVDGAEVGSITFRAASVRGVGHQEQGQPRQDAYAVRFTRDQRWLVGCVADGVSEGHRSHEAAAAAVDQLTAVLVEHLSDFPPQDDSAAWPDIVLELPWPRAVAAANEAILDEARKHLTRVYQRKRDEAKLRDLDDGLPHEHARGVMSTTAIVFAIATEPLENGDSRAFIANVAGDSSAFVFQSGNWLPLTEIKNEGQEIYSGSVRSLPHEAQVHPAPFHLQPGQAFVVMTDGLGDPLGKGMGEVGAFLAHHWRTPPDALAFAQHLAFYKKTFTDDRTAVMIWCNPVRTIR